MCSVCHERLLDNVNIVVSWTLPTCLLIYFFKKLKYYKTEHFFIPSDSNVLLYCQIHYDSMFSHETSNQVEVALLLKKINAYLA